MRFTDTIVSDTEQLTQWISADPYHRDCMNPSWWFTGAEHALTCFCLQDSIGPTMFVRLDKDNDLLRLHTQFGPESEVSKIRVVKAIIKTLPVLEKYGKGLGLKGFVVKSTSESLINFLQIKFGFTPVDNDDYWMSFEV
jgi:hypothetical protein